MYNILNTVNHIGSSVSMNGSAASYGQQGLAFMTAHPADIANSLVSTGLKSVTPQSQLSFLQVTTSGTTTAVGSDEDILVYRLVNERKKWVLDAKVTWQVCMCVCVCGGRRDETACVKRHVLMHRTNGCCA